MKIHFDNVNFSSRSGPNSFATRLAKEFFFSGVEVVTEATNADVSLVFIEPSGAKLCSKIVQRLDGIWFKPQEFQTKNTSIRSLYEKSDSVVFQSEFDKTMIEKWFSKKERSFVIYNGIEIDPCLDSTQQVSSIRNQFDLVFVCSANWHKQKRFADNLLLFDKLRKTSNKKCCLIVMGSNPDVVVADPDIFYTGNVDESIFRQVYSIADWMIHLAWADHCPNVVVECISQGTPVICADVGGTKEIVKKFGLVLKDQQYNFELYDYDNPPRIDLTQTIELPELSEVAYYEAIKDLDIKQVAKKYLNVFLQL